MSPRLSSEELAVARQRRAAERQQQEIERARIEREKAERAERALRAFEKHQQLASVVDALYEEVGKLSIKWPQMPVSQRTVDRTNKAIRAVSELLAGENDDFVGDISEFVPAGDPPEGRDVVLLLRELKAALDRYKGRHNHEWIEARSNA
jgi:hypothetical protein